MNFKFNWEAMGIAASLACAIHCALMPLLVTSLPLLGINFVHHRWIEIVLLGTGFVIGISTLWHGYRRHHHKTTSLWLFTLGIGLLALHQFTDFPYATLVLIIPSVVAIIAAHLLNHRSCRIANHCHGDDCNH